MPSSKNDFIENEGIALFLFFYSALFRAHLSNLKQLQQLSIRSDLGFSFQLLSRTSIMSSAAPGELGALGAQRSGWRLTGGGGNRRYCSA